jgi:NADH-quinone oxidoreductase subunit N
VIGAFYYLRVVYFMYFGKDITPATSRMAPVQWVVFMAVGAIVLLGMINLFGIEGPAQAAAEALLG